MFKKEITEASQRIEKSEHWSTEIEGYDVYVNRRDDDAYSVGIYPNTWRGEFGQDRMRLPLLNFHPKHVDEFTALADILPSVLRQLSEAMRAEGLVDLRSKWDIRRDEMDAERERWMAELKTGRTQAVSKASAGTDPESHPHVPGVENGNE